MGHRPSHRPEVSPGGEARHSLQMKLKRLLDIDRKGIDAARGWPEFRRFAFLRGVRSG